MAEIDDVMRAALRRAAIGADAAVDVVSARQAIRARISAGELGPEANVAPGWGLVRWGFAAHRAAWIAAIAGIAAAAVLSWAVWHSAEPPAERGSGSECCQGSVPPNGPLLSSGSGDAGGVMSGSVPLSGPLLSTGSGDADGVMSGSVPLSGPLAGAMTTPTTPPAASSAEQSASSAPPRLTTPSPHFTTARPVTPVPVTSVSSAPVTPVPVTSVSSAPVTPVSSGPASSPASTSIPPPDTEPPVILTFFATVQEGTPGQAVTLLAQASDGGGVTGVLLTWSDRKDGPPLGSADMTPSQTGWVFTVTVPKIDQGGELVFTATARDAAGNRSAQATAAVVIRQ